MIYEYIIIILILMSIFFFFFYFYISQTLNFYFIKQNKFKTLVKNVQHTLKTKVYKKEGLSLEEYVKMKWNISK